MTTITAKPARERASFDMHMVALTAALVGFGIVAVFSASFARAAASSIDSFYLVKRQTVAAIVGAVAMLVMARLSMERVRELAYGAAALAAVSLAVVLAAARFAIDNPRRMRTLKGLMAPLGMAAGLAALVVVEPDLGTAVVIMALAFVVCHFAGARARHLGAYMAGGIALVVVAIVAEPYRLKRIEAWVKPHETSLTSGYQLRHSVIALGAGGVIGRGLGESREKYAYLPAAETDCIFAIVGEETGLLGTWGLLALFALLVWRGMTASLRAADPFAALVGAGVTSLIALQVMINVAVVTGMAPTKGAPLPFVSYGGSSLILAMAAVGLLLNVSRQPGRAQALPPARDHRSVEKPGRPTS
jgi:cell division protein FtsW